MVIRSIFFAAVIMLVVSETAAAVSLTASPGTAQVGQPVTFTIGSTFANTSDRCSITVDYGDQVIQKGIPLGTPAGSAGSLTYLQTVTHSYGRSSIFTVTAEVVGCAQAPPVGSNPMITQVTVTGLSISRLELAFHDGKGQSVVRRNEQGLRARATLATVGSGLLQGYWEVDGRPFPPLEQYVTYGQTVNIETPDVPPLPTFDTGDHMLRFVITSPGLAFPLPTLVYTVTPEEGRPIQLKSPLPGTLLPYAPAGFIWNAQPGVGHYELRFLSQNGQKIFAAITKEPNYNLSEMALFKYFSPTASYYWQVEAYDAEGLPVGSSQSEPFRFLGAEITR